ncbi:MAG: ABC transporter permease [Gemmatimonadetes bacterium]|nr:ABC transporter permease [Gemmatimonadota bacterium]
MMRTFAMARKEWIQLRRDPRSMALAFLLPVMLLLFFGYAISWDVDDIPLAIHDDDRGPASRQLIEAFAASGYFDITGQLERSADIAGILDHGDALATLVIPRGFAQDLAAGRPAGVQLLLDGSDANTATIALNYADAIVARHSRDLVLRGVRLEPPASAEVRVWYNPTLESRQMIVPGLIAVIMSIIAAMLTALTIAREWERGTMEQLASTPVHRLEIVAGKLVPYLGIGLVDVAFATAAGMLIFGVPLRGSLLLLGGMTLLFLLGALGLGMFISAALRSQVLATQVAMVATYLPALLLSGFLFDIAAMPVVLRAITNIVPARYYIAVTRGVFLKGVGLDALWVQGISMVLFALVGIGLAAANVRKRLLA